MAVKRKSNRMTMREPIVIDDRNLRQNYHGPWYVYLLPAADRCVFKVGFTCNPFHRIYSFNRRYFERVDLDGSLFLKLANQNDARKVEKGIKDAFANFRSDQPAWVQANAGGQTEWFDHDCILTVRERIHDALHVYEDSTLIIPRQFIGAELLAMTTSFELWAHRHTQLLLNDLHARSLGYPATIDEAAIRDWLDAYRAFDIPLYRDDPSVLEFIDETMRLVRC